MKAIHPQFRRSDQCVFRMKRISSLSRTIIQIGRAKLHFMLQLSSIRFSLHRHVVLAIFVAGSFCSARGEVRLVRRLQLGDAQHWSFSDFSEQFDSNAIATTPRGDFLLFSARRDGGWKLFRVRGWQTEGASVDRRTLPGYFSTKQKADLELLTAELYITKDGHYAICIGSASWRKRVNGQDAGSSRSDNLVTVVDLESFSPVNAIHTKDLHLFDQSQQVTLDAGDRILVESSPLGHSDRAAFIQLMVPSLTAGPKCSYEVHPDGKGLHPRAVTQDQCEKALGPVSLASYLDRRQPSVPPEEQFSCEDAHAEYCPQPDQFTNDKKFGLGLRTEGHDSFWGSWVQTRDVGVIFSMKTRHEIGELDLGKKVDTMLHLVSVDSRLYLLALRGGELSVYEVEGVER